MFSFQQLCKFLKSVRIKSYDLITWKQNAYSQLLTPSFFSHFIIFYVCEVICLLYMYVENNIICCIIIHLFPNWVQQHWFGSLKSVMVRIFPPQKSKKYYKTGQDISRYLPLGHHHQLSFCLPLAAEASLQLVMLPYFLGWLLFILVLCGTPLSWNPRICEQNNIKVFQKIRCNWTI